MRQMDAMNANKKWWKWGFWEAQKMRQRLGGKIHTQWERQACVSHTTHCVVGMRSILRWQWIYTQSAGSEYQVEDGIRDRCVTGVNSCAFSFSSRRRHTRSLCDWSSDVCSSD